MKKRGGLGTELPKIIVVCRRTNASKAKSIHKSTVEVTRCLWRAEVGKAWAGQNASLLS